MKAPAFFENLSPKNKRIVVVGGASTVFVLFVYLISGDNEPRQRSEHGDGVHSILLDRDTRELSVEALNAQLRLLRQEQERQNRLMERQRQEIERATRLSSTEAAQELERARQAYAEMQERVQQLEAQLVAMTRQVQHSARQRAAVPKEGNAVQQPTPAAVLLPNEEVIDEPYQLFREPAPRVDSQAPADGRRDSPGERRSPAGVGPQIRRVAEAQSQSAALGDDEEDPDAAYIPLGSIITAVLLNGADAPTGQQARQDPIPVLARVKKEAILPNRFHADIRECFILLAGHGDLSSERALFRGDALSCVSHDGQILEAQLRGYAVGEDGKVGVRGTLVSKQGQLIAASMSAGFLEAMSRAFSYQPVPVLATRAGDEVPYQRVMSNEALQSATLQGAGRAMERVADFYLKLADQMHPVVEVDAAREINIVLTSGVRLRNRP
jgi:conjugal transfer pilus assembly protein TraB